MNPLVIQAADLIKNAHKILIFTGAGLSTESGIPDFRSPGGIWDRYDPSEFYFDRFISSEASREKYWEMSTTYYQVMKKAQPNPAHLALKKLDDTGRLLAIVTQNIDHLHHQAGHSSDKIIEIHGTAFGVSCLTCGKQYNRDEIEARLSAGTRVPYCDDCSGILKPNTISFGQAMPEDKMEQSLFYAQQCDLCLALGSSLVVYPAASIPQQAVRNGAHLIIINRDETPLDPLADLVVHDSVSTCLDQIMDQVLAS
ncbi:MAG: Sir2 family NAD-dependent protein deacetylase [Deltaproteobacteria bacterium]|nr:Sir2 family NAD-dependent protein deacetylase [Deltaproteobacteria bacterium]